MSSLLKQLIREEISAILDEEPKDVASARSESLALFIGTSERHVSQTMYILFDAAQAEKELRNQISSPHFKHSFGGFSERVIKAFIQVTEANTHYGKAYGTKEVKMSMAVEKYGPMIYDTAMGKEGGLVADRDFITPSAKKVWKHYDKNRADVKKLPLDNYEDPKTITKEDDSEFHWPQNEKNPLN